MIHNSVSSLREHIVASILRLREQDESTESTGSSSGGRHCLELEAVSANQLWGSRCYSLLVTLALLHGFYYFCCVILKFFFFLRGKKISKHCKSCYHPFWMLVINDINRIKINACIIQVVIAIWNIFQGNMKQCTLFNSNFNYKQ